MSCMKSVCIIFQFCSSDFSSVVVWLCEFTADNIFVDFSGTSQSSSLSALMWISELYQASYIGCFPLPTPGPSPFCLVPVYRPRTVHKHRRFFEFTRWTGSKRNDARLSSSHLTSQLQRPFGENVASWIPWSGSTVVPISKTLVFSFIHGHDDEHNLSVDPLSDKL